MELAEKRRVNYFGGMDWESFFGAIIARGGLPGEITRSLFVSTCPSPFPWRLFVITCMMDHECHRRPDGLCGAWDSALTVALLMPRGARMASQLASQLRVKRGYF